MQAKLLPCLYRCTAPFAARLVAAALFAASLLLALGVAQGRAAESTLVESSRQGNLVEIRATADLAADRDTAWRVLTDYARYTAFIPDLRESRVVSRTGTTVIVEQAGSAKLGPLNLPIEITFQIRESPPDGIESRAVSGSLRSLDSHYALTALPQGSRLVYTGYVRPAFPLFGRFGQSAIEANITRQFRALVDEIERHHGSEPASSTAVGR